jgi:hypothetical protein
VAYLQESNYLGSIGAQHYYARIEAHSPSNLDETEGELLLLGCYGTERDEIDNWISRIDVTVERRLTKVEKDMNDEVIGAVGDWTYRFNLESEAKAAGVKLFLARFEPGWVLISGDDCDLILAQT